MIRPLGPWHIITKFVRFCITHINYRSLRFSVFLWHFCSLREKLHCTQCWNPVSWLLEFLSSLSFYRIQEFIHVLNLPLNTSELETCFLKNTRQNSVDSSSTEPQDSMRINQFSRHWVVSGPLQYQLFLVLCNMLVVVQTNVQVSIFFLFGFHFLLPVCAMWTGKTQWLRIMWQYRRSRKIPCAQ